MVQSSLKWVLIKQFLENPTWNRLQLPALDLLSSDTFLCIFEKHFGIRIKGSNTHRIIIVKVTYLVDATYEIVLTDIAVL